MDYNEKEGVWRTVAGRKIFIPEGQSLSEALASSGKFGKPFGQNKSKRLAEKEYAHVTHEISTHYSRFESFQMCSIAVGKVVYLFENHGFDNYVIFRKESI